MTHRRLLPLAALLLALTACTPEGTPSASPSPSPVGSLPSAQVEHLEFYEEFDRYNNGVDKHDFQVSEERLNGSLHYRFQNEEHGVDIYVTPRSKTEPAQALLYPGPHSTTPLEFEMPVFLFGYGNVSGVASFHLEDLTGDGSPELIYIYGWGGTGVWKDSVKVFDLSSTTECPVIWDNDALAEYVQLKPVELRDAEETYHTVVYAITGPDGEVVYGCDLTKETTLPESAKAWFGGYESIGLNDGSLIFSSNFSSDLSLLGSYVGSLSGSFVYDAETASFSLQPPYTMTLFEPVAVPTEN